MVKLKKPKNSQVVWQYMDFIKFVSILDKDALFFNRVDKFDDVHEGLLPYFDNLVVYISEKIFDIILSNVHFYRINSPQNQSEYIDELAIKLIPIDSHNALEKSKKLAELLVSPEQNEEVLKLIISQEIKTSIKKSSDFLRQFTAANCWFMGDESVAMWKLYSSEKTGVAIKTTFGKLYNSFSDKNLKFSEIKYTSSPNDYLKTLNGTFCEDGNLWANIQTHSITEKIIKKAINPYFIKRNCFENEKELRILKQKDYKYFLTNQTDLKDVWPEVYGEYIPVDVNELIEEIYVSPKAQDWFVYQLKSLLNQYGFFNLTSKVKKSELYVNPLISGDF